MNKYQKALDELIKIIALLKNTFSIHKFEELINKLKALQELVDRATPKKPNTENLNYICCPSCHSDEIELYDYHGSLVKLKHCNNCGQALYWSKNE